MASAAAASEQPAAGFTALADGPLSCCSRCSWWRHPAHLDILHTLLYCRDTSTAMLLGMSTLQQVEGASAPPGLTRYWLLLSRQQLLVAKVQASDVELSDGCCW